MSEQPFTPADAVLLLIDHQDGIMSWVRSMDLAEMKANALALARAAKAVDIPLVLTSSLEDQAQGRLMEELAEVAPHEFATRVRREGVVNALDDPAFDAALRATGRRNIIIAGVTNDVCTVFPTLTALEQGFRVQVVGDAGGSMSKAADEIALRRMERAGAEIVSTNMTLAGLANNWTSDTGIKIIPVVASLIPR